MDLEKFRENFRNTLGMRGRWASKKFRSGGVNLKSEYPLPPLPNLKIYLWSKFEIRVSPPSLPPSLRNGTWINFEKIFGIPRVGVKELRKNFGRGGEPENSAQKSRILFLFHWSSHSDLQIAHMIFPSTVILKRVACCGGVRSIINRRGLKLSD